MPSEIRPPFTLAVLDDELATCVGCGLCLPHCPTFRATGEEALSPRGRIAAMRDVRWNGMELTDDFVGFMETCVQCRGCEPACPSGVPFGRLMEGTRESLAGAGRMTPWWQRLGMRALGRHRLLVAGSRLLALAQRLRLVPKRLGLMAVPLRSGRAVASTGHDVWLFTGCVMDAWLRATHRNTAAVIAATGTTLRTPQRGGDCCGALHTHAGLGDEARRLATRVMASMPGDAPILVNSAGCGAELKDYGHLLGTDAAVNFAARVRDVHEWLADRADLLPSVPTGVSAPRPSVIVQDPCHLRHVQRSHGAMRAVLGRYVDIVELDDDGLCCGAGGAYSAMQPELAGQIRDRKLAAIERASGGAHVVVASANPGCAMHLSSVGVMTAHPMDIIATATGVGERPHR